MASYTTPSVGDGGVSSLLLKRNVSRDLAGRGTINRRSSGGTTLLPLVSTNNKLTTASMSVSNTSDTSITDNNRNPKGTRKVPLKTFSFTSPVTSIDNSVETSKQRSSSSDKASSMILPDYHRNNGHASNDESSSYNKTTSSTLSPPKRPKRNPFVASESGTGSILPITAQEYNNNSYNCNNSSDNTNRTRSTVSPLRYGGGRSVSGGRSTFTDSFMRVFTSPLSENNNNDNYYNTKDKVRSRTFTDGAVGLPLHTGGGGGTPDSTSTNNNNNTTTSFLRSRRSRATVYEETPGISASASVGGGSVDGYMSMDGGNDFNPYTSYNQTRTSSSTSSWFAPFRWFSSNSHNNSISGSNASLNGYNNTDLGGKVSKRRNSGNSHDFVLPLTVQPSLATAGNPIRHNSKFNMKSSVYPGAASCRKSSSKVSNWFQTSLVLVATSLVWHSYQKFQAIQTRLEVFQDKESLSLLHLKTVEEHLVQLHENVGKFASAVINNNDTSNIGGDTTTTYDEQQQQNAPAVDANLIKEQAEQLQKMGKDLDAEVRTLQTKIQQVARSSIVTAYGEGPVQIVLELDFFSSIGGGIASDTDRSTISILLWYDTPHAAWTWLQQIRNGQWMNAKFRLSAGAVAIEAAPTSLSSSTESRNNNPNTKLKFVERSKKRHEAWTVGLSEIHDGTLQMFINLQDNTELRKHEVCVGKIIDGFDALQRLVDATRTIQNMDLAGNSDITSRLVSIKNAYATHVTARLT